MKTKIEGSQKDLAELVTAALAQRGYKVTGSIVLRAGMVGDERGGESYPSVTGFEAEVETIVPPMPSAYDREGQRS